MPDMDGKKVVAHILNTNSFSGAENVVIQIIDGIKEEYQGVYVTRDGPIVELLKERNIDYFIINKLNTKEIRRMCHTLHPAVIHAHDFTTGCVCAAANTRVPIISHLHNNPPWIKSVNLYSLLYFICSRKFKKILLVSPAIEEEYVFSKHLKDKMECVGNPISREKILSRVSKEDYAKKYDICCVARLSKPKNPKKFLEVVKEVKKKIPHVKCVWVGTGELKDEIEKMSHKMGLVENIDFVGFQSNPYSYLAASKIFLLTSSWEGFGLVAFEALTLGLPCVVSNVGGLKGIVDSGCGKLCDNEHLEDYSVIVELLENENRYQEYAENALKRAEKLDNYKEYVARIKEIIEDVSIS
ncbi:MAG: glycosyltransferase [Clostridia bacterium]|nr:glycosyltransferase [Clostridia bacterium]